MQKILLYILGVVVVLGIGFFEFGDRFFTVTEPTDTEVGGGSEVVVETPVLASYFKAELLEKGVADVGQPIEGFDAGVLMQAFPGLTPRDFDGVATVEGHYTFEKEQAVFSRDAGQPVSSAERTISDKGYAKLLDNLAARLAFAVTDRAAVDELIQKVDTGQSISAAFGLTGSALNVSITPMELLEDSRCPSDVQCIQAGTVRIKAKLVSSLGVSSSQEFTLMQPVTTEGETVTLVDVAPTPVSTETPDRTDYMFVFEVKGR